MWRITSGCLTVSYMQLVVEKPDCATLLGIAVTDMAFGNSTIARIRFLPASTATFAHKLT